MSELKRDIIFRPAFDKRDPIPSKNYGIHGVDMRFVLMGELGAVQFVIYTNWHLPEVQKELEEKQYRNMNVFAPIPADIGYHSPKPIYEGQSLMTESCEYLGGKPCYYDGSGLYAKHFYDILVTEGGDALWKSLEEYYHETFEASHD